MPPFTSTPPVPQVKNIIEFQNMNTKICHHTRTDKKNLNLGFKGATINKLQIKMFNG